MDTTIELFVEPCAIVVDVSDEIAALCDAFLIPSGLHVHRVTHAYAAFERIAALLPRLVVVPAAMRPRDLAMIEDRAAAVGAVLLHLDSDHGNELLAAQLELTVQDLEVAYGSRRSS